MPGKKLKRTSLYASGASVVNMLQAVFYNQDCIVYDLEDSVPLDGKDAARFLISNVLRRHRPEDKHIQIRVNGIYSIYFEEDLEAAVRARPDALRVPKVETAEEVRTISRKVAAIERKAGIEEGSIKLWCTLESHIGVLNAKSIAEADPRVEALILGAEDFTASMRARRTKEGPEIFYARNAMLMACRAAGVDAIDALFPDVNDVEGLKEDAKKSKTLGFDGKTAIHPRQVDIINDAFTPTQKEINYAIRVLDAIEEGKRQNKGAVSLDGSMIDKPIVIRAQTVMALAKAAGIKIGGDYYER
ncbi:MAG: HpcH/HpaI aldolase/citrate lyase family protein [Desulfovibrio sp.]|jgi:citrate lyase subunit beta/citryl-CoA lyase|nr:HpcH/HpaI aldolase/citrate lyase family protein [Desulfovibrio sp.]